ncbi:MAG TPA: glycosyltransferase, partial [Acidimicrobiia bacterium]|nr:glycosyltransferase [Acidimicrobiia bacterium]
VGGAGRIGEPGVTHLVAPTYGEWYETVRRLLTDGELRRRLGRAGRDHAVAHHTVGRAADAMAKALHEALG